ncbi:klebicin B immunity [Klebsiella pneumoniae]|nr:klebicin B immunity [Klebsiella pneumoniae]
MAGNKISDFTEEEFTAFVSKIIGNDSNLLIVFYVQIVPDDFVMQLHRF